MPSTGGSPTEQQQATQGFADVYAAIDQVSARIAKYNEARFWSGLTPKAGQVMTFDGATKRFKPGIIFVRKSADETVNNSTTLQNDDDLKVTIGSNEVWVVRFVLFYDTNVTANIKFHILVPSGATGNFISIYVNAGTAVTFIKASPFSTVIAAKGTAIVDEGAYLEAVVINGSTAGNVQLRWAQDTNDVFDTKVLATSFLSAQRFS